MSELETFLIFFLDPYYHRTKQFVTFCEANFKLSEREAFVRFLFSVRHSVEQLPNAYEFNSRAIDRMIKHCVDEARDDVWPWQVEDFSRGAFRNSKAGISFCSLLHALFVLRICG